MSFTNIISTQQLGKLRVEQSANLVLLDCRAKLGDVDWGYQQFLDGHLPGAIYADLDRDLADPPGPDGRHPLPDKDRWLNTARRWGITAATQVIAYDDAGGFFAARAWWMLRWLGLDSVAVLDGGMATFTDPLETGPANLPTASDLSARDSITRLITTEALAKHIEDDVDLHLVDARAHARWAGQNEPIDPVAGHIPNALCLPCQDNLDANGLFKSAAELRARFADLVPTDEPVVCYCGSGVTAAHNVLAMHIAGLPEPMLYASSWSGWITDATRPIATANE